MTPDGRQKLLAYLAAPVLVGVAVLVRGVLMGPPTRIELGLFLVAGVGISATLEHLRRMRRRQAELQRTLAVLTRCDEAILHATSEARLLSDVCNLLVDEGGYRSCWVGAGGAGEHPVLRAVAHAGREGDPPGSLDVACIREKRIVVDRVADGEVTSLPLLHDGEALGVIAMHADHPRAFGAEELRLLQRLGADVAFGVHAIRQRSARERAETERAEAVGALERERARFQALIEHSTDVTLLLDRDGTVAFVSPAVRESLGYEPSEITGRSILDFVHPDDRARSAESLGALTRGGAAVQRLELRMRRADGSWSVAESIRRNLLDHPSVRGIVVNVRDVTEQVRTRAQLLQAQKMESVGRLAGGVAHDFNNLLTVILACGEDLRERIRDQEPPDPGAVEDIVEAADRAREMTRQLLAFARKHVAAPAVVDLNQLVLNTAKLLRRMVGEDVKVVEHFDADAWSIRCDPGLVDQALINLAVNARDAMPSGGTLTVSTENVWVRPDDPRPEPSMPPGQYVRLSVADTGSGITPEVQGRMFEPFFTTKDPGVGTGLGLSMVYGIVRQSDAFLAVRSAPGAGTAFDIFFPRILVDPDAARVTTDPPRGGSETILLVEDEPRVRDVAERALRSGGYRVLVAGGPEEAESVAAAESGPIHALVSDVVMPGGNGPEVARRIARARPGIRVLFVSGYPDEVMERQGMGDRLGSVLPKPFTPALLLRRVRDLLDGTGD